MANVTGRVLLAGLSSKGKKGTITISSRYGSIRSKVEAKEAKLLGKKVLREVPAIIPKAEYSGMINDKYVFIAPKDWKGGHNAK